MATAGSSRIVPAQDAEPSNPNGPRLPHSADESIRLDSTKFVDNTTPRVYSLTSEEDFGLCDWLAEDRNDGRFYVIVIPRDITAGRIKFFISPDDLRTLANLLEIPLATMEIFFQYFHTGEFPRHGRSSSNLRSWHAVPFQISPYDLPAGVSNLLDPTLIFNTPTSHSPSCAGNVALLIVNNKLNFPTLDELLSVRRLAPTDDGEVTKLRLVSSLSRACLQKWNVSYISAGVSLTLSTLQFDTSAQRALEVTGFTSIGKDREKLHKLTIAMQRLRVSLEYLSGLFACDGPDRGGDGPREREVEMLSNYRRWCCSGIHTLERLAEMLGTTQTKVAEVIRGNQNKLLSDNTKELRRIAQLGRNDATKLEKMSQRMAKDSRQMKLLAFLNMAFLPSAVVAAFFSMPFMALDENMLFRSPERVWIFFVTSLALTSITFAISIAWDRHEDNKMDLLIRSEQEEPEEGQGHDADNQLLEGPAQEPHPDPWNMKWLREKVLEDKALEPRDGKASSENQGAVAGEAPSRNVSRNGEGTRASTEE